jgi:hypothetical protein
MCALTNFANPSREADRRQTASRSAGTRRPYVAVPPGEPPEELREGRAAARRDHIPGRFADRGKGLWQVRDLEDVPEQQLPPEGGCVAAEEGEGAVKRTFTPGERLPDRRLELKAGEELKKFSEIVRRRGNGRRSELGRERAEVSHEAEATVPGGAICEESEADGEGVVEEVELALHLKEKEKRAAFAQDHKKFADDGFE